MKNEHHPSAKKTNRRADSPQESWSIRYNIMPGDLGYLTYLHGVFYAKEYGYDETFEAYVASGLSEFIGSFNEDMDRLWLAEMKGQIIGSMAIAGHSEKEAQLHWFFVHPDYRGLGLGKVLINRALEFCKKCGYKTIFLWTTRELRAAGHIYSRYGFGKTEDKTHNVWGKEVTEERYDLKL